MRKFTVFLVVIVFLISALNIKIIRICSAADITAQTGLILDWWKSNANIMPVGENPKAIEGSQWFIPLRIGARYQNFTCDILMGNIHTTADLSNGKSQSLTHISDTKVNCAYEILDILPINILLGLDFNLPTGQTDLTEDELSLIPDDVGADLVSITKFGEGFNINPTISLAKEWEDWMAGMGLGYDWRGKYDYSTDIKEYDPGDIFNFTTEVSYDFHLNWQSRFFSELALFSKDQVKEKDWYQEGDFLLLGLELNYYQTQWDADISLQSIQRGKSERIQDNEIFIMSPPEDKTSHGDEWIADIGLRYSLDDRTRLNSSIEFLWADENDSQKQKISLGVGATTILASFLEGNVRVKGFYLDGEIYDYRGISIIAQLTANF